MENKNNVLHTAVHDAKDYGVSQAELFMYVYKYYKLIGKQEEGGKQTRSPPQAKCRVGSNVYIKQLYVKFLVYCKE